MEQSPKQTRTSQAAKPNLDLSPKEVMSKEKQLEVLLHEHTILNAKIDEFIGKQFVYITTLLTISGSFIYVALADSDATKSVKQFLPFLPYIQIALGPTFLFKFNRAILLHGYRHFIEERINALVGKNYLFGAKLVKKKLLDTNTFARFNYIVLGLMFVVSVFFCHIPLDGFDNIGKAISNYNFMDPHLYIQVIVIIGGVFVFIRKNRKAFEEGNDLAFENFDPEAYKKIKDQEKQGKNK